MPVNSHYALLDMKSVPVCRQYTCLLGLLAVMRLAWPGREVPAPQSIQLVFVVADVDVVVVRTRSCMMGFSR